MLKTFFISFTQIVFCLNIIVVVETPTVIVYKNMTGKKYY